MVKLAGAVNLDDLSEVEEKLERITIYEVKSSKKKLRANFDRIPHGVSFPLIKPKSIDDVPILALTFHSTQHDHLTLMRRQRQQSGTHRLHLSLCHRYHFQRGVPSGLVVVGFV